MNRLISLKNRKNIAAVIILLSLAVIVTGYIYYKSEESKIREERNVDLSAIATLKSEQISAWYIDQLRDAESISKSFYLKNAIEKYLATNGSEKSERELKELFGSIVREHSLDNIILAGPDSSFLFSLDKSAGSRLHSNHLKVFGECANGRTVTSGIYFDSLRQKTALDFLSPWFDANGSYKLVIIFQDDPNGFLIPFVKRWPTFAKTAETLIIRKEGDDVLFLNDLRFRKNAALNYKIPLTDTLLPAVQAVMGKTGVFEGIDYRGKEVLSVIGPIEKTPWYMVAKVDKDELYAGIANNAIDVALIVLLGILFIGASFSYVYVKQQRNMFKTLYKTREEFKATLYSIGDAVIVTDTSARITHMNPVAEKITGWREEDAIYRPNEKVFRIIDENTGNKASCPVKKTLETGNVVDLESNVLLISRRGKEIPITDCASPVRNAKGKVTGAVLVFRDQSEGKRQEKIIQENARKLSTLMANLPGMAYNCKYEKEWTMDFVSEGSLALTGYIPEEIMTGGLKVYSDIIHPEDREMVWNKVKSAVEQDKPFKLEYRVIHRLGQVKWVWEQGRAIKNENGAVEALEGFVTDITDQKYLESALKQSEIKYRQIVEGTHDGVWKVDANLTTTFVNRRLTEMLGYDEIEMVGRKATVFMSKTDAANFLRIVAEKKYEQLEVVERKFIRKDGSEMWCFVSASAHRDEEGNFLGSTAMLTDITKHREQELALKESEERFRNLYNSMLPGVVYQDAEGHIISANPAAERLLGLTLDEMQGRTSSDPRWKALNIDGTPVPGEDHPAMVALRTGKQVSNQIIGIYNPKIDKLNWLLVQSIPQFRNGEDKPYEVFSTFNDITELENTEKALERSREEFRSLFMNMTEGVGLHLMEMNADGLPVDYRIIKCNPSFKEIVGFTEEKIEGRLATEVYGTNEPPYFDIYSKVAKERKPHYFETYFEPMGKHFAISAIPWDQHGFATIFTDITERKKAEEKIYEESKKWQTTFDTISDPVSVLDVQNRIVQCNKAFADLVNKSYAEILGKSCHLILHGTNGHIENCPFVRSRKSHDREEMELKLGDEVYNVVVDPLFTREGEFNGAVHMLQDITKRKKTEEALTLAKEKAEEMNRIKTSFFANMSHELRTPFVGILGYAGLLAEITTENPDAKELADGILRSSKRLVETLTKILDVTKLEFKKTEVYYKETELKFIIYRVYEQYVKTADVKGLTFEKFIEPEDLRMITDESLLIEALNNLVSNAIKFTDEGYIKISAKAVEDIDSVEIIVEDSGIGIPEEKQSIVWEEFRQVSEGSTRSFQGTGLGLSIVKKYVELLGGDVTLKSKSGEGSKFIISLPVKPLPKSETNGGGV